VLIELLWPERDVEQGRHSLSVALSSLRDQLEHAVTAPDPILVADRISVGLNADAITTDIAEFEAAIKAGAETGASERIVLLARAVELYQGELLRGYVENWILPEQQRLDELFFQAIRQLIALLEANGEFDRAIRYARQAVGIDPLREEAHHELMRLLAAAGYSSAALRQYRELERVLKAELDASPDAATRRLALEMREQLAAATADPTAPATATLSPAPPSIVPASRRLAPLPLLIRQLEPIGGAVPLESPFYVIRPTDEEFGAAIERQDSIVLVKGSRQVGKTSLLARGLQCARQAGALVVLSDLDLFHQDQLATPESLLIALAETLVDQLELDVAPADAWDSRRGANASFRRYLRRHVLATISTPIVWGLDQVDRLFPFDYSGEVFALFRSWHNERVLDPAGP
jgi:DNA-binding SARP family transcriptional activator